jgi:stage II sporulation protein Q
MEHRRIKKSAIYLLYSLGFVLLVGVAYLIEGAFTHNSLSDDIQYVSDTIMDDQIKPVIAADVKILRPYKDENVKILKNYYQGTEDSQVNSIIVMDNTYLQSTGICYGGVEFDVTAVLDGKILSIEEDELLGTTIQIEHDNKIISIYQSVANVTVKEGEMVSQGDIIATTGTNNLNKDLGNHLYFELVIDGQVVNPENYFDKSLSEL